MSHTEAQAKLLWCPMARIANFHGSNNRVLISGKAQTDCFCLASGCAVWVWDTPHWEPDKPFSDSTDDAPTKLEGPIYTGHCGLIRRGR